MLPKYKKFILSTVNSEPEMSLIFPLEVSGWPNFVLKRCNSDLKVFFLLKQLPFPGFLFCFVLFLFFVCLPWYLPLALFFKNENLCSAS